MTTHFTIRPAVAADAPAVLVCLHAAFEPFRSFYSPEGFRDTTLDEQTAHQRLREMHVLVATTPTGEIVGTVGGSAQGREGHLRGMAVLPSWVGSGLAQELLTAIEGLLRSRGCTRVTLDTTEPLVRAMRFYERNGYTRTGDVGDFYGMPLIEYAKDL